MKKKFLRLSILFLIFATFATLSLLYVDELFLKSKKMLTNDIACQCVEFIENDPYERPLRYVKGQYTGKCVNSCQYRAPQVITTLPSKNIITVANVFHQDQFWTAAIPVDAITQVDILFENFAPGINHVAFRFNFDRRRKISLQSQTQHDKQEFLSENSLVISPEAVPPFEQKYTLWDGFWGNYAMMNRILSYEQYQKIILKVNHPVRSYKAKLKSQEAQSLFTISLLDAKNISTNQYQLLFNNCATTVIDYSLQAKKVLRSKEWDLWDVLDPLRGIPATQPIGTLRTLVWWDLIDQYSDYSTTSESN